MSARISNARPINSPRRDGVEQCLGHPNELGITDSMHSISTRGTCDDIEFSNCIALSILSDDVDTAAIFLRYGSDATIDDDVEAVADIFGAPENLSGVNLNPVQRAVDVQN